MGLIDRLPLGADLLYWSAGASERSLQAAEFLTIHIHALTRERIERLDSIIGHPEEFTTWCRLRGRDVADAGLCEAVWRDEGLPIVRHRPLEEVQNENTESH